GRALVTAGLAEAPNAIATTNGVAARAAQSSHLARRPPQTAFMRSDLPERYVEASRLNRRRAPGGRAPPPAPEPPPRQPTQRKARPRHRQRPRAMSDAQPSTMTRDTTSGPCAPTGSSSQNRPLGPSGARGGTRSRISNVNQAPG